jgi:hypothetical protein
MAFFAEGKHQAQARVSANEATRSQPARNKPGKQTTFVTKKVKWLKSDNIYRIIISKGAFILWK